MSDFLSQIQKTESLIDGKWAVIPNGMPSFELRSNPFHGEHISLGRK